MDNFFYAFDVVMKHECDPRDFVNGVLKSPGGGFVNDPKDPGGVTVYGIAADALIKSAKITPAEMGIVDFTPSEMMRVTLETAETIYEKYIWRPNKYDAITDKVVATKVFDVGTNIGCPRANRMIQRAAGDCGHVCDVDGIVGEKSIEAINACDPRALVTAMCVRQKKYYEDLVIARPSLSVFLKGWLKRAAWCG